MLGNQAGNILADLRREGFAVTAMQTFVLEQANAEEFLEVYKVRLCRLFVSVAAFCVGFRLCFALFLCLNYYLYWMGNICMCMHMCASACARADVCAYVYVCVRMRMCGCVCSCMCACVCACVCVYLRGNLCDCQYAHVSWCVRARCLGVNMCEHAWKRQSRQPPCTRGI